MRRIAPFVTVFALVIGVIGPITRGTAATCSLVPQLRDVTINQGLGSYTPLVRGKETVVRLYLSMPSCAGGGVSMSLKSAALTVKNGTTTLAGGITPTPDVSTTAPPPIPSYTSAALLDGTGDPKFVVPGSALAPSGTTGRFTATFSAVVGFQVKSGGTTTTGSVTLTRVAGASSDITAAVDARSNALRVLVVPFGKPTDPYADWFGDAPTAAVQNAMTTLGRIFPVPDGISRTLGTATGGIRYQINPSLLDLTAIPGGLNSSGRFCGTSANFNALKAELAQFLLSWNTANPGATADRVLGVVAEDKSDGSSAGCAEGMASLSSPEAWIRAVSSTSPSDSGALAAMELAHTFGLVLDARDDPFSPAHSPFVQADGTAPNRAYNVSLRSFLNDDHTVMTLAGTWNNDDTLLEKADYELLHCRLGGSTNTECTTPGTTGTSTGVAAGPVLVMSGTTDGTPAGTDVLESYTSTNVARTTPDATSAYRLVQRVGSTGAILRNDGVPVSFSITAHDPSHGDPEEGPVSEGLFAVAFPFDTAATTIQLWNGAPGAAGSVKLYERSKDDPPVISTEPVILLAAANVDATTAGRAPTGGRGASGAGGAPGKPVVEPLLLDPVDQTFTVDTTDDTDDYVLPDGTCADAGGRCSLRAAIQEANATAAADAIVFDIGGTAPFTISLGSGLPTIVNPVEIDGTTQPGFAGHPVVELSGADTSGANGLEIAAASVVRGLVINGFNYDFDIGGGAGLYLASGSGGTVVQGNYIGTNVDGTTDLGNDGGGIVIASGGNTIGGTAAGEGNLISGNGDETFNMDGISVDGGGNTILGNLIGTNADDSGILGNAHYGVEILGGNDGNVVGGATAAEGNVIRGGFGGVAIGTVSSGFGPSNGNAVQHNTISDTNVGGASGGVYVEAGSGNLISENSISNDAGLGIALTSTNLPLPNDELDADGDSEGKPGNDGQNYPDLTSATVSGGTTTIAGTIDTEADQDYTIELFSSDTCHPSEHGEGGTFLGSTAVTTDSLGSASFSAEVPTAVSETDVVTATATDGFNNTSEFSTCVPVTIAPTSPVNTTVHVDDANPGDVRVDFRAVCPGVTYILDVAERLDEGGFVSETNDPGPMCPNPHVDVFATDGFLTATAEDVDPVDGPPSPHAVASIYGPSDGATFLQYENIALVGGGNEQGDTFQWLRDGSPISGATTPSFDPPVPSGGWPVGDVTFALRVTAPNGTQDTAQVTVHILADEDNDGVPAAIDEEPCIAGGGDHDPTNSYLDSDGDGVPNSVEVTQGTDPCVPNTSYQAIADFNPDTLNIPSTGQTVTVTVSVPYRSINDVLGSSVRITKLGGIAHVFTNTSWTIKNGKGIARFDRQAIIDFIVANGLRRQRLAVVTEGSSKPTASPAPWSFRGEDSFFAT